MTYYLIGSHHTIPNITYNEKDFIILFNYSRHILQFKDHNRNILVMSFHKGRWKRINEFADITKYCRKIYIAYREKELSTTDFGFNECLEFNYTKFNIHELESRITGYPEGYIPSTGFLVFNLIYPRSLCLVGFTGKGWHGHNFEYEQQTYKNLMVNML